MKYVKNTVLFLLIAAYSFSCTENNFTSTNPEAEVNSSHKKTNATAQSSQTVRYDNFSDNMGFVLTDRRWHQYNLTYYFQNGTSDITGDQEKQAIEDALDLWTAETDFSFREVNSESNADIVILWATGAHGDGSAFDGTNGVLAHAFLPPSYNSTSYAGDVHFDGA